MLNVKQFDDQKITIGVNRFSSSCFSTIVVSHPNALSNSYAALRLYVTYTLEFAISLEHTAGYSTNVVYLTSACMV